MERKPGRPVTRTGEYVSKTVEIRKDLVQYLVQTNRSLRSGVEDALKLLQVYDEVKNQEEVEIMILKDALNGAGIARATLNGLVFVVKDDQADYSPTEPDGNPGDLNDYILTIANGGMPPHYTKSFATIDQIDAEYNDLEWLLVEEENEDNYGDK